MIKSIVLDFGNVIYKIAPNTAVVELIKINGTRCGIDFDKQFSDIVGIIYNYEKGVIDSRTFRYSICNYLGINLSDNEFDRIWNIILVGLFPYSESAIAKLSKKYSLYLLSNTNEIHSNHFMPVCNSIFNNFKELFFSFKLKMIKPETDIYKYLFSKANISPNETLFVDDLPANTSAAKQLGIQTELISESFTLEDLANSLL